MDNLRQAEALVRNFLHLLESRQMEAASKLLATDAYIVFPAAPPFEKLNDLIPFARQ